ncbi:MAG: SCO family protein [Sandaracinaceae bacterium]|nr:SCO family protein [Sandaracinaceae bacterium]
MPARHARVPVPVPDLEETLPRRRAALAAALSVIAVLATGCGEEPLPELLPIGEFALVDQDGEDVTNADLRGKVWIVDFVFTSCPDVCPVLTTQMANLHRRIDAGDVRFVSVSVDPAEDTPERLREYAARFGADTSRWSFLDHARPRLDARDHRAGLPGSPWARAPRWPTAATTSCTRGASCWWIVAGCCAASTRRTPRASSASSATRGASCGRTGEAPRAPRARGALVRRRPPQLRGAARPRRRTDRSRGAEPG